MVMIHIQLTGLITQSTLTIMYLLKFQVFIFIQTILLVYMSISIISYKLFGMLTSILSTIFPGVFLVLLIPSPHVCLTLFFMSLVIPTLVFFLVFWVLVWHRLLGPLYILSTVAGPRLNADLLLDRRTSDSLWLRTPNTLVGTSL